MGVYPGALSREPRRGRASAAPRSAAADSVHPRTRARLDETGLAKRLEAASNVHVTTPVGYLTMLALLVNARLVLTDSGGLQKEAYVLRKPCVTVSAQTAWVETVASGWNRLVNADAGAIREAMTAFDGGTHHEEVYGRGDACAQIRDRLVSALR